MYIRQSVISAVYAVRENRGFSLPHIPQWDNWALIATMRSKWSAL